MDTFLKENERIDDLEFNNLKIIQNKNYFCFGIDAILLANFAKDIKNNSTICDLCSGNGIISILLSNKVNCKKIYAVEIQQELADMCNRSIKLNNLESNIEVINTDLNLLNNFFENNFFDSIICNPPYKNANSGLTNINKEKLIARHEIKCTLEDVIKISSKLLKNNGSFYMVHRPNRLVDVCYLLRKYKLEPKTIKFVLPYENKAPNLFLIKAVKGAKSFLNFEPNLIVYNNDGSYTNDLLKIYGKLK